MRPGPSPKGPVKNRLKSTTGPTPNPTLCLTVIPTGTASHGYFIPGSGPLVKPLDEKLDLAPLDAFVSYDERQSAAARLAGLRRGS
jgi:hypothetical protein